MRRCKDCKSHLFHSEHHDTYYCKKCNAWSEKACLGAACTYCDGRPEKPSLLIKQNTRTTLVIKQKLAPCFPLEWLLLGQMSARNLKVTMPIIWKHTSTEYPEDNQEIARLVKRKHYWEINPIQYSTKELREWHIKFCKEHSMELDHFFWCDIKELGFPEL